MAINYVKAVGQMTRRYPTKDVKLLFSLSAGRCAFANCRKLCVEGATAYDEAIITAKIAHIEAHSDEGPRANPSLTLDQRDCYENWILLCGTHHDVIHLQSNTYTVAQLKKWKAEHEQWITNQLVETVTNITFHELEIISSAIMGVSQEPSDDMTVTPPKEKMMKNALTSKVSMYIRMGMLQSSLVEAYVSHMAIIYPDFPEKLKNGFIQEYKRLREEQALTGDNLFFELMLFASSGSAKFERQAAGLTVLVYLFIACEVFEK